MIYLVSMLQKQSLVEQGRFRKFVESPYFNSEKKLIDLLDHIYRGLETREALHEAIFDDQPYSYTRINNLLSDLKQLYEQFLIAEYTKENHFSQRYPLMVMAERKGLPKLFRQISNKWEKYHQQADFYTDTHFLQQHLVADIRNTLFIGSGKRDFDGGLDEKLQMLDLFYLSARLKTVCQLINRKNVIGKQTAGAQHQESIAFILNQYKSYLSYPIIQIYYAILLTLTDESNESTYRELKRLIYEHIEKIPSEELQPMFQYAQNYCIKQSNLGHTAYLEELFELYKTMIERGLIYYQDYISPPDVKNIVTLAVRLRAFDWAEDFMQNFAERISPDYRKNTLTYNRAYLLHHGKGESRKAMRLLTQVEFNDIYYYLGARTLLLEIYYELYEQEALESLLHAFSKSLRANKQLSAYHQKVHLNLIRFVKKLSVLRTKSVTMPASAFQKVLDRFQQQLMSTREVSNLKWLQSKLEELRL